MTKDKEKREDSAEESGTGRKLAEWITFLISAALILAVAGYMLYQGSRDESPIIVPEIRPLYDQAQRQGAQYVLPVEVRNTGDRTLRDLKVEAAYTGVEGKEQTREHIIEYLGERARETLYFYFDADPKELDLTFRPHVYHLG